MKHCHISIMSNELPFLKRKLPFLYDNFDQLIFVDYDMYSKSNSCDGSIEYIEEFDDIDNKITLIKNFDPNSITEYRGVSYIEKQKMFSKASDFVSDDMDVVWATDLDEFFEEDLIGEVESLYNKDEDLISIDLPHLVFVYNQYNYFNVKDFYIAPRITKHKIGFVYGHCDFASYGKTIKLSDQHLYHFAFVGYDRCDFKINKIYTNIPTYDNWLKIYFDSLKNAYKYVNLPHPNRNISLLTSKYEDVLPKYIDDNLFLELNNIKKK